jgi:hypothetical protein
MGLQMPAPHLFGTPFAPHMTPAPEQVPHDSMPPHPSGTLPQSKPRLAHVEGTHAHACSSEQAKPTALQSPQARVPPQPSSAFPQL